MSDASQGGGVMSMAALACGSLGHGTRRSIQDVLGRTLTGVAPCEAILNASEPRRHFSVRADILPVPQRAPSGGADHLGRDLPISDSQLNCRVVQVPDANRPTVFVKDLDFID